jgi:photosystem I P700 chlorophyll a apoprotein A1
MFSDTAIQLQPIFAQWIQNAFLSSKYTAPNALASTSPSWVVVMLLQLVVK